MAVNREPLLELRTCTRSQAAGNAAWGRSVFGKGEMGSSHKVLVWGASLITFLHVIKH